MPPLLYKCCSLYGVRLPVGSRSCRESRLTSARSVSSSAVSLMSLQLCRSVSSELRVLSRTAVGIVEYSVVYTRVALTT